MPNRYDLISINGYDIPDVVKGSVSISRNPKYTQYEGEDGGKIIDLLEDNMIKGSISFNALLQTDIQNICANIEVVSEMSIYNPINGNVKTFMALIETGDFGKVIHDDRANAWTFSLNFEEIGDVPNQQNES